MSDTSFVEGLYAFIHFITAQHEIGGHAYRVRQPEDTKEKNSSSPHNNLVPSAFVIERKKSTAAAESAVSSGPNVCG